MKITTNTKSTIASQGVQSSSGFAIATTAHMFGILSDGLYSDKIGAVLREIGANAMDAHIMAGKADQPFELKLPSQFDKTFHIKDFGPGLSDQDVRELYTTYGWSSKQNSNEVTGAFGLGSKSPFAYTDAFSICAVKDGVKRIYTAHKDDTGKPVVSLMSETKSDDSWQAGVMVTFAVQPDDIGEFIEKAGKIFRWFKVKPNVIGAKVDLEQPAFKTRGPAFALFAPDADRQARVIMANVAYPLHVSRLEGVSALGKAVAECGVHLFVPTGTVMPTPNREDLQYDKASRPALIAALQDVAQAVAQEIYDRVKAEESSTWEWRRRIREYAISLPDSLKFKIKDLLALVCKDPIEAKKLENLFSENYCDMPGWVGDGRDAPHAGVMRDAKGDVVRDASGRPKMEKADVRGCRVWAYALHDRKSSRGSNPVKRREVWGGKVREGSNGEYKTHKVSFTDEVIVMVGDAGRADMRVKYMMDLADKSNRKVLLVQPTRGADKAFVQAYAEKLAGDTAAGLGGLPIWKVSDIELPKEIVERAKASRMTVAERREAFIEEEERRYFSLTDASTPSQLVPLADYDEPTDKYFVVVKDSGGRTTVVSHTNDHVQVTTDVDKMDRMVQAVANLRAIAPLAGMTGFFMLSPQEVTRLKLVEAGWKPAMMHVAAMLQNKPWTAELTKVVDTAPVINVNDDWQASQAGMVGILAMNLFKGTEFGKKVKASMPGHTLVLVAERLVSNLKASQDGKLEIPEHRDVGKLIEKVNALLPSNSRMPSYGIARMSASDVKLKAVRAYPTLQLLDLDKFKETARTDPQMAANLFWQFANLQASTADSKEETALQQLAA